MPGCAGPGVLLQRQPRAAKLSPKPEVAPALAVPVGAVLRLPAVSLLGSIPAALTRLFQPVPWLLLRLSFPPPCLSPSCPCGCCPSPCFPAARRGAEPRARCPSAPRSLSSSFLCGRLSPSLAGEDTGLASESPPAFPLPLAASQHFAKRCPRQQRSVALVHLHGQAVPGTVSEEGSGKLSFLR